jgi:hypothetical protein
LVKTRTVSVQGASSQPQSWGLLGSRAVSKVQAENEKEE